jgi:protein-tyrosine phosphatase
MPALLAVRVFGLLASFQRCLRNFLRGTTTVTVTEVLPELLVGSCPKSAADVELLTNAYEVSAVLNLQTNEDVVYLEIPWPELVEAYSSYSIEVERMPVNDADTWDLRAKLPEAVRTLERLLKRHRRVYVHCTAGAGRSPTTVVAYLHWSRGWDLDQAVAHVTKLRPCTPDVEAIRAATEAFLLTKQ